MRNRRVLTGMLVVALAGAGLVSAMPVGAQVSAPTLRVEPASDLVDGQSVQYDGSGWSPGAGVAILQCVPGATSLSEVLAKCAIRQSATVDANGSVGGFVTVERMLQPLSGPGPVLETAKMCDFTPSSVQPGTSPDVK